MAGIIGVAFCTILILSVAGLQLYHLNKENK